MSKLYYNNLRYNGAIPTIKTFGGTLDAAMFNGVTIGEETSSTPAPSYTVVDWVYSTNGGYYFDTGILADKDLKIRLTFKQRYTTGGVVVGFSYDVEGGGYDNYRIFNYESKLYFDIGWNRIGDSMVDPALEYSPMTLSNDTAYDVTFGNFYYEDNDNADVYGSKSIQVDPSYVAIGNHTIKVWPSWFAFHNIQIWNSNNTLLFDGLSVTDANGYAAIYDSVSGTYFRDSSLAADTSGGGDEPVEEPCTECGGSGTITESEPCSSCGGSGMIQIPEFVTCPECDGSGVVPTGEMTTCPECGGSGEVDGEECPECGGSGEVDVYDTCPSCGGSGTIEEIRYEPCPSCGGTGQIEHDVTCPHCDGTGIEPEDGGGDGDEPTEVPCPECGGSGYVITWDPDTCPECGGSGEVEGDTCLRCGGSGTIEVEGHVECPVCEGTGYITE